MKNKSLTCYILICLCCLCTPFSLKAHDITFCGERIPVDNNFVGEKLMNVIRKQIPYVNLPQLRKRALANFPIVEYYLRETNLPEDFKYLAIVESGFLNEISSAGAGGFWQLMPETARELGLIVSSQVDERNDIHRSTLAACKVLANYYMAIRKTHKISSWVLTAAAYNFGIGSIFRSITLQGKDYFSMKLNPETAVYVYKIIAVKELFEYPELYLKNFSYNIFSTAAAPQNLQGKEQTSGDLTDFTSMEVKVTENDGQHPDAVSSTGKVGDATSIKGKTPVNKEKVKLIAANIKGKYKNFNDGSIVAIELQEDLQVENRFTRAGNVIKGIGWIIDDRVFIDLGFSDHTVILYDSNSKQGIPLASLKNEEPLILKVLISDD